ncbi:E3 ubiquitin-protein ligase TRIM33 isoform X1 [Austrofundulus limnaeus]|uniref:E3 ubiquitin-protein ligase TRIM33 isoform X1 n=1 Tax=Austrofundulus limnaeus TaxID=52670 RepID=A0A2I4CUR5_AUSLI|nr:PREDICTED: E3 ubiquitin-protein ligase TRIM33-like isoform X1 [Austrofundulus limnaeus]
MLVGSNHSVQDQEVQQESEVDKRPLCVSESAVLEFREKRPLQKLSSSGTPQIRETAALSEEIHQVSQNIVGSESMDPIFGPLSPPSSDIKLTTTSLEETDPQRNLSSPKAVDVGPDTTKSEEKTFLDGLFSPISSEDELPIDPPEETKPTGRPSSPEMDGIERFIVKSEESETGCRPYSPISSEDEVISLFEETKPTRWSSPEMDRIESFIVKYEESKTGLFSPISSEDELPFDPPEETKPTGRPPSPEMDGIEGFIVKSEDSKTGLFSPVSSEDEFPVVVPEDTGGQGSPSEETDPPGNQPSPERHDIEHVPVKSDETKAVGSPGSSDDERTIDSSEDDDPALNLSASESDGEVSPGPKPRQQDFSQPQWQPQVSLVKLPLSVLGPGSPESCFQSLLEESEEELPLQEGPANNNMSDSTNDDFMSCPSSPGSPLSVEVISCSACASPNASKICSDCGRGYHSNCHIPPVGPDIWSDWICSLCQDLTDPSDPYSSDRRPGPEPAQLSVQDQRRCEALLLHLKVEGCGPFSETP